MRHPNTRPTNIYWLFDVRSETVAVHGPKGQPFYCGKTVSIIQRRLVSHFGEASRAPDRPVLVLLNELGRNNVRIDLIETVPVGDDWGAREKHWIAVLREINPDCCNVSSGGAGAPGYIATAETLAKMSAAQLGRTHPEEVCARISEATKQRMALPDERAKLSAKLKGRVYSAETLARMSAGQKARFARKPNVHSPETRAKISATAKLRGVSEKTRAGHKAYAASVPSETRAKMSESAKRRGIAGLTRYRAERAAERAAGATG